MMKKIEEMTNQELLNKIRNLLRKDGLLVRTIKGAYGEKAYMVIDVNNVVQAYGMDLTELAKYADMK